MVPRITSEDLTGLKPQYSAFIVEYMKDRAAGRSAEAVGYNREYGSKLLAMPEVKSIIDRLTLERMHLSGIDVEWLLHEMVDNHYLARQQGKLSASNTILMGIGKHIYVDAFAAEKVVMSSDIEIKERLLRGRKRNAARDNNDEVSFL
jgi:hypothetical protein